MTSNQQQEQLATALRHLRDAAAGGASNADDGEAAANDVLACTEQITMSLGSPGTPVRMHSLACTTVCVCDAKPTLV